MTEVLFYHLDRRPLEDVLPALVAKTLERGWRAVVQAGSPERVEALSNALWAWREDAFLPHGSAADGNAALQPVWLTDGDDTPNAATVRFLVDGASARDLAHLARAVYLFDGADAEAVAQARDEWKRASGEGHEVTYWQQDEAGRWTRKA